MARLKITEIIPNSEAYMGDYVAMDSIQHTYDTNRLRNVLVDVDGFAYQPNPCGGLEHFYHMRYNEVMRQIEAAENSEYSGK